jgi:hypothetical protein
MSASSNLSLIIATVTTAAFAVSPSLASDEQIPDAEFLEYLGFWDESDEDWLLLENDAVAENEERSEPVPQGEVSTETEDES